jgi:hypothetical protein
MQRIAPYMDRCTVLTFYSAEAAAMVADRSLDYVFIDGNHSYENVKEDIALWKPKVQRNGILLGHDYKMRHPGVVRAVNELIPRACVHFSGNTIWWVRKWHITGPRRLARAYGNYRVTMVKRILSCLDRVRRGVEVGVWRGETAAGVLEAYPSLKLALVDPYNPQTITKHSTKRMRECCYDPYQDARWILSPLKKRCHWMQMTSREAAPLVGDETLDYVFIDALHTHKAVKEDIALWFPKIRPGGVLIGDDYSGYHREVIWAVDEQFGRHASEDQKIWWVWK